MYIKHLFAFIIITILSCGSTAPDNKKTNATFDLVDLGGISNKEKAILASESYNQYRTLLLNRGFNGQIILAKKGEIIFEDYQGYLSRKTMEPISASTPLHIASTSKTFTAIAILRLIEQGKISLENKVADLIPQFPYNNITLFHLLTHRSGLPNYTSFMEWGGRTVIVKRNKRGRIIQRKVVKSVDYRPKEEFLTNDLLIAYINAKKTPSPQAAGRAFNYCNTNFALLASIVEKVTGQSFPNYMRDSIFIPLGMNNTFVFSLKDTANYIPSYQANGAPYPLQKLDCIYGDKNIYSTVRDLLIWDKALYGGDFISKGILEKAFTGYSNERRGTHNYGLGFRLLLQPTDTVVYHNGWWHGNNVVFKRHIKDSATVIIIGNKFNRSIYGAGKLANVLTGNIDTTVTID
ncbi:MAG: serine hydrolase domain-containing protein [Chitinophagaceae bacterium]